MISLILTISFLAQECGFIQKRKAAKDHVALIIGNSNYPDVPLDNPKNDVSDMASAFERMGFIVEKVLDVNKYDS